MSASLVVLFPVILLGVVTLLCFTGCGLDTSGTGQPVFTQYSNTTVLGNPAVVGYWPLSETGDNLPAVDRTPNPDNGQYIDQSTLPAIYPWPDSSIGNAPSPNIESAAAPGSISFAQPGSVSGDFGTPHTASETSATSPRLGG